MSEINPPDKDPAGLGTLNRAAEEPFACPVCGQMLGPGSRICAVCKAPVDPSEIKGPAPRIEPSPLSPTPTPLERARFPWKLFALLLLARLAVAASANRYLGLSRTFLLLGVFEILCGVWVGYDAIQRGVPKPFRWGLGSALLWILVFPWYLTRRRMPWASCPFIEAEAGPVTRAVFFALVVFFLLSVLAVITKGSPPG
jgi:hypothetical protein